MIPSNTKPSSEDGFREYKLLLLAELERLNKAVDAHDQEMSQKDTKIESLERRLESELKKHGEDISALKIKASVWSGVIGGITGLITTIMAILMYYLRGKFEGK